MHGKCTLVEVKRGSKEDSRTIVPRRGHFLVKDRFSTRIERLENGNDVHRISTSWACSCIACTKRDKLGQEEKCLQVVH